MERKQFTKAMIDAGKDAMVSKIEEVFGSVGVQATKGMSVEQIADVMWGLHKSCEGGGSR